MATRRIQLWHVLAEASNPISLPTVPLPNASTVSNLLIFKTQYSLMYKTLSYQPMKRKENLKYSSKVLYVSRPTH